MGRLSEEATWQFLLKLDQFIKEIIFLFTLTHCILADSSTVICWLSPFVILWVPGLFYHFLSAGPRGAIGRAPDS